MAAQHQPPESEHVPALSEPALLEAAVTPVPPIEDDPFATFSEWASNADTAGYANL